MSDDDTTKPFTSIVDPVTGKRPRGVQKGEVRNPYHKGKLTKFGDIAPLMEINQKTVGAGIRDLMAMDIRRVESIEADINAPAIQRLIAKVLVKAVDLGDTGRLSFLLDRAIGPMPKEVFLGDKAGKIDLSKLSIDELQSLRKMVAKSEGKPITVEAVATSNAPNPATATTVTSTTTDTDDDIDDGIDPF